jgi:hypothetical protein
MVGAGQAPLATFEPGAQDTGVVVVADWPDAYGDAMRDPAGAAWLYDDYRS